MKKIIKQFCFWALFIPLELLAGTLDLNLQFDPNDIQIGSIDGYDFVTLKGTQNMGMPGTPYLPAGSFQFLIPADSEIVNFQILDSDTLALSGFYLVYPAHPGIPISSAIMPAFVDPDPSIYNSLNPYPDEIIHLTPTGAMSGYRIGCLLVYPIQYIPASGKLILYTNLTVRIVYQGGVVTPKPMTERQKKVFRDSLEKMISNPDDIEEFSPPLLEVEHHSPGSPEYVVVTTEKLRPVFEWLTYWKTRKGIFAKVKTYEEIEDEYDNTYLAPL